MLAGSGETQTGKPVHGGTGAQERHGGLGQASLPEAGGRLGETALPEAGVRGMAARLERGARSERYERQRVLAPVTD